MKPWRGKELEYRGFFIKNDKQNNYLKIYDKNGTCLFQKDNRNHGSIQDTKKEIDIFIKRYGE